ncbi:MAG: 23S rRNA (guanosine(2251)-2'-O)-methyltransferase RlmB [Eubacteriales bacterium]
MYQGNKRKNGNNEERRPERRRSPLPPRKIDGEPAEGVVFGRNEVRELLRSGRSVDKLFIRKGELQGSVNLIVGEASERGIPIIEVEKEKLDSLCGGGVHQGVAAMAAEKDYCTVEDILAIAAERGEAPFIAICDGIEDPYNLGALIRCAECAGVHGVIIPKRRAAGLTPTAAKASAGAVEHMAIAKVTNIAAAIDELKAAGVWTYAAEAGGENMYTTDMNRPAAFVFGSEGNGVSRLVREKCDFVVSIPMYGKVNSMNVSTAAAVILTEAARRRHAGN